MKPLYDISVVSDYCFLIFTYRSHSLLGESMVITTGGEDAVLLMKEAEGTLKAPPAS
ncbi:MAG: hypothetical protein AB2L18_01685 [Anaerolineaceae bacterium]